MSLILTWPCLSQGSKIKIKPIDSINQNLANNITKELNHKKDFTYRAVVKKIKQLGYFDFEIKKNDTLTPQKEYVIKFNNKLKTIEIKLNIEDIIYIPKKIKINKKNKVSINTEDLEILLLDIGEKIKEKGNMFFEIKLINIKKSDFVLTAELLIELGEKRKTDKIIIKGYEKFPRKFIRRHLDLRTNQIINLNTIKKQSSKLNTLKFAKESKTPELLFKKDSTIIYMYIDKEKRNSFDGVIGFNTDENDGKLDFTGYLSLNLLNNFNKGEEISLNYRSDENKQRLINIQLNIPYILKTAISSKSSLNIFSKDSTFTTTNISEEFFKKIGNRSKIGIGIESVNSKVTKNNIDNNLIDYTTNSAFLNYEFKKTNTKDQNKKDVFYLNIKSNYGSRKTTSKNTNQVSFEIIASKLITLNQKNYFHIKNTNKKLFSKDLIQNELYRFGGINTIRGFDENKIEANTFNTINIEYIHTLNNSISINTITDFAYFENINLDQKEKLISLGLGIETKTKSGLLNLIIATGKTENTKLKFSNAKIHISLKTFF